VLTVAEPPTPFLQVARNQRPSGYVAIIARTAGDAPTLLRDMRRTLLALEPNLVFVENQTMAAQVDATMFPARAGAWLVSGVGLMAMLVAAIGLTASLPTRWRGGRAKSVSAAPSGRDRRRSSVSSCGTA